MAGQHAGAFIASQQVIPAMKRKGRGDIIVIGATASPPRGPEERRVLVGQGAQLPRPIRQARHLWPAGIHVAVVISTASWTCRGPVSACRTSPTASSSGPTTWQRQWPGSGAAAAVCLVVRGRGATVRRVVVMAGPRAYALRAPGPEGGLRSWVWRCFDQVPDMSVGHLGVAFAAKRTPRAPRSRSWSRQAFP